MKTFRCSECQQILYFESTRCLSCQCELNFLPDVGVLSAMQRVAGEASSSTTLVWQVVGGASGGPHYRQCKNQVEHGACNWAIPVGADSELCVACELNGRVPDVGNPNVRLSWHRVEAAKRRLLYSLSRLGLAYCSKNRDPQRGLRFDLVAAEEGATTGHADGVITINLAEADPGYREQTRERLGEDYRTLLGHFRHESGHYYWGRLLENSSRLDEFRTRFGDERADYARALQEHYATPAAIRRNGFVSAYAQTHPWEDWAETWAHYLHMVDTLETARGYGLSIQRNVDAPVEVGSLVLSDFEQLLRGWVPVTLALNSLNRSMGQPDPYPFTLDEGITAKLRFVHDTIALARKEQRP